MTWTLSAFADEAAATCDEQIVALKRSGLTHIDIRGIDGHNITALPLGQARIVRDKLDQAGIHVAMYGSPIGKIDIADDFETDIAKLRHLGDILPILGCGAVRIFSYYNRKKKSHTEWQETALSRLLKLRESAKNLGLVLYHENERDIYGDLAADVEVIGNVVRDGVTFRMIFDFDNYNQSKEDVWANWQRLHSQVDAFHLKDSKGSEHVPVGSGDGRVVDILTDAVRRGWSGPCSVEPHLSHSTAVAATGPSGTQSEAYGNIPTTESFHIACEAAKKVLTEAGASFR